MVLSDKKKKALVIQTQTRVAFVNDALPVYLYTVQDISVLVTLNYLSWDIIVSI